MAISIEKCDEQGVVSLVWAASKLCLPVDDNLFWGKVSKIVAELPLELITQARSGTVPTQHRV